MSIYRPYTLCVTFWHCSGPEQWNFFVLDLNGVGVLYTWECCVCILTVVNRLTMVALTREYCP